MSIEAMRKALNYIENTEGELGIKLSCGDALREALAAAAQPQVAPTQPFYGARCAAYPNCSGGCGCGCTHEIGDVEARIAVLSDALKRISKNTCCDNCQEAARVARSALGAYVGLARQPAPDMRDTMREIGELTDPVREMLRRMLAEHGDEHYHNCPADDGGGPCKCFAGALHAKAKAVLEAALAAQPPAAPVSPSDVEGCDQCPEPKDGPHHPECYRYVEPASERWTVGKNGWDASDEATREDI